MAYNDRLSAEEIARSIAHGVAALALNTQLSREWCHSILFPLGYFEREVIKTVEVIGGVRRVAVPFEIVRIDFNLYNFPPLANEVRRLLHVEMTPLLKGSGRILENTPEGLVIVLSEKPEIRNDHTLPLCAPANEPARLS
ncbi:MAG: hypothetical protein ABSG88_09170 [Bradyrhizobium sp.]